VLHLAIGVFDFSPERHEATAVTESAEDSGDTSLGLTHEFPWSGLLHANNAVAVMFSPTTLCRDTTAGQKINAPWSEGSHGEALVFFSPLPDEAKGEDYRDLLAHTFNGRPVVMNPQWVLDRFPDQYTVALTCPNMPVSLELMRSQTPVFNPRVMQMMCPAVLSDLNNVDSRTGAMGKVTPQTPGTAGLFRAMPQWVSGMWPTVQRDLRFGFAPVTWQVLLHGFGGRSFISEYPDRAKFPAPYQVTTSESFSAIEIPLQNNDMVFKPHQSGPARVIQPDQYGGRNNPLKFLTAAPPGLVIKSGKSILNLHKVTYIMGSGKTPYLLTFGLQAATRSKYITKGKYQLHHYNEGYAVSATYLRTYFHPLVLQMAVREIWDASRFSEAAKGGSAIISNNNSGRTIECTAPDTWPHFTARLIERVGAHPDSQEGEAGCLRGAVRAALEAFTSQDLGALAALESWDEWAEFESLPERVQSLNDRSTAARCYKVLKFKQQGQNAASTLSWANGGVDASPATARCAFTLLLSPQGRARLLAVGIDRVIFRPMSPKGWKNHAMAAVARSDGLWYLLVPDAGGDSHKSTLLHGSVPGVTCVLAAYALAVASRKRRNSGPPSEMRVLVKRKSGVGKGKFFFPEPPTLLEARNHQEGAYMDFAFRAWVGVVANPSCYQSALEARALLGPVLLSRPHLCPNYVYTSTHISHLPLLNTPTIRIHPYLTVVHIFFPVGVHDSTSVGNTGREQRHRVRLSEDNTVWNRPLQANCGGKRMGPPARRFRRHHGVLLGRGVHSARFQPRKACSPGGTIFDAVLIFLSAQGRFGGLQQVPHGYCRPGHRVPVVVTADPRGVFILLNSHGRGQATNIVPRN